MKKIIFTAFVFILSISVSNAKISQKNYFSIFQKYNVKDRNTVQKIINICVNKFGKNNLKVIENNNGEKILDHKNEKGFLDCTYSNILNQIKPTQGINSLKKEDLKELILENELYIDFGKGKVTYIFNNDGYEIFQNGKKIGNDGWRWTKLNQLRVFMDGKKATWRVSRDKMALAIKKNRRKKT